MKKQPWRLGMVLGAVLVLGGCGAQPLRPEATVPAAPAHDNLNATLWMQQAAEYQATVRGIYAAALRALDAALQDPGWDALPAGETQPGFEQRAPAIIVDADETLIDNSHFQARAVIEDSSYSPERWQAWVNTRKAAAMPGAVAFAREVAARGVTIFYITNRDAPHEYEATLANLRQLGFPLAADAGNLLLRGDPRLPASEEKGERRRYVGRKHRVLLMLGDNLGDFLDGVQSNPATRQALMAPYQDWWGGRWFMLPNPSYGSWQGAILRDCKAGLERRACLRAALRQDE